MWIHMKSYICMDPSPFDVFADDLGQVLRDTHLRIKFWIRVPIAATCRMQSGSAKANLGILSGLCCFAVCFGTRSIRHRSIKWFYHVLSLLEDDHFLLPACAYSRPGCITEGEYGKKKNRKHCFWTVQEPVALACTTCPIEFKIVTSQEVALYGLLDVARPDYRFNICLEAKKHGWEILVMEECHFFLHIGLF